MKGLLRIKEPRGEEDDRRKQTHGLRFFFLQLRYAHFDATRQQLIDRVRFFPN